MRTPLCPLWPRAAGVAGISASFKAASLSSGLPGALFVLLAAGLLAVCILLPVGAFVGAERSGSLDPDAFVGPEPVLQNVGPLAPVFVEINARGLAFICGKRVSPPALRELLRRTVRIVPDQQVIFKINESTPTQYLGPFMDACTAAGIRRVDIIQ